MSKAWLNSLLRARQAREDLAAQELAAAERASRRAVSRVRYDRERLESLRLADAAYAAPVFVAAAAALQAAAATHAAAIETAFQMSADEQQRRSALADAAGARRSVEELRERDLAEARKQAQRIAQGEMDEIAGRVVARAGRQESAR